MKKVLIIQTAFLGDVILATPIIANLKLKFPEVEIDFLVKKGNEELLNNHPDLMQVFTFDKKKKRSEILRLIQLFRKNQYDLVINLHRFASSGLFTVLSGAKRKIGFQKNPFSFLYSKAYPHQMDQGLHEVDRNLNLISDLLIPTVRRPALYPKDADLQSVEEFQKQAYYCLAPASVWFTKQAPESVWVQLIKQLNETGALIYLIGGPDDKELLDQIIETSTIKAINLAGKLSLMQSAALMKGATRAFVNDSGPLHIASAMNTPVTAFFCSTVSDFGFGPLSDDAKILEVKDLACRPCGLHGHQECPKGHFKCGTALIQLL
jgi:heptosyltransferase-2